MRYALTDFDSLSAAILAFAMVMSAVFGYLKSRNREKERTRRLQAAIAEVPPAERPAVIDACSLHEASCTRANGVSLPRRKVRGRSRAA